MSANMFSFAGNLDNIEVAGASSKAMEAVGNSFVAGLDRVESASMGASNAALPEMATESIGRNF